MGKLYFSLNLKVTISLMKLISSKEVLKMMKKCRTLEMKVGPSLRVDKNLSTKGDLRTITKEGISDADVERNTFLILLFTRISKLSITDKLPLAQTHHSYKLEEEEEGLEKYKFQYRIKKSSKNFRQVQPLSRIRANKWVNFLIWSHTLLMKSSKKKKRCLEN